MDSKSKQLKQEFVVARAALSEAQEQIKRLETKVGALVTEMPRLSNAVKDAERRKALLLADLALDKTDHQAIERIKKEVVRLQHDEHEAGELLEACQKSHRQLVQNIPALNSALLSAQREFWTHVLGEIKTEMKRVCGELPLRALACVQLIGGGWSLASLVADILQTGHMPDQVKIEALQKKLQEEYGLSENI